MKIDLTESFPHLHNAPITEAVIGIRARAERAWEEAALTQQIKSKLPEYPKVISQTEYRQEFKIAPGTSPVAATHNLGFKGLRLQSQDDRQIAQFNKDGFVFSRLRPYEDWERFSDEAMRLWQVYVELACPMEAQEIGLRYINRIELPPQDFEFEDYIKPHPQPPQGLELPFSGFFQQDTLTVPGSPYVINLFRTIQPPQNPGHDGVALILDIGVASARVLGNHVEELKPGFAEMRWLKNKAFFGSITEKAKQRLQ